MSTDSSVLGSYQRYDVFSESLIIDMALDNDEDIIMVVCNLELGWKAKITYISYQ